MNTKYWTSISYFAFYVTSFGLYIIAFFVCGVLTASNVLETPQYLVATPHFYLVTFLIVGIVFAMDAAVLAAKEIFFGKSKEKALRKLMKSVPKRSKENNKWMLLAAGSTGDCESNLMSFAEAQDVSRRESTFSAVSASGGAAAGTINMTKNMKIPEK